MPKPAQNGATGQQVAVPQAMPAVDSTLASPTPAAPTNPNAPVGGLTGADQPGDVWAPGTGPGGGYNGYGGKSSKGGVPPSMGGGPAPGSTPGAGPVGGGWAGPNGQPQQPGGAGAFQGQYDAIKNKLGEDAAQTFAVKNWGSGGQQAMQQRYGGDSAAYNAAINAHGAGGVGTGISGRTVVGPDGQRYQVGEQGTVKGAGSAKRNRALFQDQAWLNQNAVKL